MAGAAPSLPIGPEPTCALCPRLAAFRDQNRSAYPDWSNAPVPSFGPTSARLLVAGLAPGLRGANRTGRPFTGDGAGVPLYKALRDFGFSRGDYGCRHDDGLTLTDCRIVNVVRCVPPQNKPVAAEIAACRRFLTEELQGMPRLQAVMCLGRVSHDSIVAAHGLRRAAWPFAHGGRHRLPNGVTLFDSYHCSRYNLNTRVLTREMFRAVFADLRAFLNDNGA